MTNPDNEMEKRENSEREKLTNFFFYSFQYSQGDTFAQTLLYEYARRTGFIKTIDEELFDAIANEMEKRAMSVFKMQEYPDVSPGHQPVSQRTAFLFIADEINKWRKVMQKKLNIGEEDNPQYVHELSDDELLQEFSMRIIKQDYKFLIEEGGREYRKGEGNSHWSDKNFSFVVTCALRGEHTREVIFHAMYQESGKIYRQKLEERKQGKQLTGEFEKLPVIIEQYNRTHPNNLFL